MNRRTLTALVTASILGLAGAAHAGPPTPNVNVSGTVSVDNFPETQGVSVANFPATQKINGSVTVSNSPSSPASVLVENGINSPVPVTLIGSGGEGASQYFSGYVQVDGDGSGAANIPIPEGKMFKLLGVEFEAFPTQNQYNGGLQTAPGDRYRYILTLTAESGSFSLTFYDNADCLPFLPTGCASSMVQQFDDIPAATAVKLVSSAGNWSSGRFWEPDFSLAYWGVLFDGPAD